MEVALGNRSAFLQILFALAAAAFIYRVVWSLILHPLSNIPGPKYAAVTSKWQFYFDVVRRGRMPWEIKRLHEQYGPVVRIGPNEVHVADAEFYDQLYTGSSRRRDRDPFEVRGFGLPDAVLCSPEHNIHRSRRGALSSYFSAQAIGKIESVVYEKLKTLCDCFEDARVNAVPVNVELAFMALTTDIITQYCFARSYDYIKQPGFSPDWLEATVGASEASMLGRYLPFLPAVMKSMPPWLVKLLSPPMMQLVIYTKDQEKQVQAIKNGQHLEDMQPAQRTIIHELLESTLPESEKSTDRVAQEAQTLVAAGSATTSFFLKSAMYFVLADPKILWKLRVELDKAIPALSETPPSHSLQQLPFLTAVVKETSRLVPGAFCRLGRIAPDEDLRCGSYNFPAGTIISMTSWLMHNDPSIFQDPESFQPQRWLDNPKLEKYLVPFSKGSRACLGINLAYAEIYCTLAVLFRRFEFELFQTTYSDVALAHEFFIPISKLNSKGVRLAVRGIRA